MGKKHRNPNPSSVSYRQVVKVLEHLEFEFVRQVGSHMRYAKGKRRVTVAKYSWYSHDVFSFMMDQIGTSKKYFFEVLDEIGR